MDKYCISWIDASIIASNNTKTILKHIKSLYNVATEIELEGRQENDEWMDFSAAHYFSAKNDKEAKQYTLDTICACGRNIDVFTLTKTTIIATEDDIWDEVECEHLYEDSSAPEYCVDCGKKVFCHYPGCKNPPNCTSH